MLETFAPAAILINQKQECLYSLGPTDRYLRVAPGPSSHDLLAMVRVPLRNKLRAAIQQATQEKARVIVTGGRMDGDGAKRSFSVDVQPVRHDGEDLLLICFIDESPREEARVLPAMPQDIPQLALLEQELAATRTELQGAIRNLEIANEEHKSVNEQALSFNEEYQSTNEELLTSKEELQSLNEELAALNNQLQETLERQRKTSDDLQNVLYSTDVATLFLDAELNISFFTPATKSLFSILTSDVGRPLADLNSRAMDDRLLADAQNVLQAGTPIEREVQTEGCAWFARRIVPYRSPGRPCEGVVITYVNVTERRMAAEALENAKQQAQMANLAKSRFLAAASHDLRQPLQSLVLLQGLMAKTFQGGPPVRDLLERFSATLGAMSTMLNALLDINQIETGAISCDVATFPIGDLLDRLGREFTYLAEKQDLAMRVVSCGVPIRSDPRLLEQVLRNFLANALKYTLRGKVLLGCRRHEGFLSIEVWDTGVGVPETELENIFEAYHQLNNPARARARGLGLGLSTVRRLADLMGHPLHLRSQLGKGSVFSIDVPLATSEPVPMARSERHGPDVGEAKGGLPAAVPILVVEDDPDLRELLDLLLTTEGYGVTTAPDGVAALDLLAQGAVLPALILSDYNLPNGIDGFHLTVKLRQALNLEIPAIILTGDISTGASRDIALDNCVQIVKPVLCDDLAKVVRHLLAVPQAKVPAQELRAAGAPVASPGGGPIVYVVDDDSQFREMLRLTLEDGGRTVVDFGACEDFLEAYRPGGEACLLIDAYLPGMKGIELLQRLHDAGHLLPAIMITGRSDVAIAVQAMKAGALNFIEKPISGSELLASVDQALEMSRDSSRRSIRRDTATGQIARLTPRQKQIMDLVLAGHPSKNIAADLGISQRTVENHRSSIMKKTGSKSLPALARTALAATSGDGAASSD